MSFSVFADYATVAALLIAIAPLVVWIVRRHWEASERKAESLDRASLRELEERRDAVVEARRHHDTRLVYQTNRTHVNSGLALGLVTFAPVLVVLLLRFLNAGGPFWYQAFELAVTVFLIGLLGWLGFSLLSSHDRQLRTARDFDRLEAIERRIAAIHADPLDG